MKRNLLVLALLLAVILSACGGDRESTATLADEGASEAEIGSYPSPVVEALQRAMMEAGYYAGPVDGLRSDVTADAVGVFQEASDLPASGVLDNATLHALADASDEAYILVVGSIQHILAELGFYTDTVDGIPGPNTVAALTAFQSDVGVATSGELDDLTFDALVYTYYEDVTLAHYAALEESGVGGGVPEPPKVVPEDAHWRDWIQEGDTGDHVSELQQRLSDLGFRPGEISGVFGKETASAVMAFQKMEGLQRDSIVGPQVSAALEEPTGAGPERDEPGRRVEVDLDRQIMFAVDSGGDYTVINVSTGSGKPFQSAEEGKGIVLAHTPIGDYEIIRRIDGLREAPLGTLYYPLYFDGGWAIHGSPHVPGYPASHGCVRTDNWDQDFVFDFLADGDPVWIHGDNPPLPDNAGAGA